MNAAVGQLVSAAVLGAGALVIAAIPPSRMTLSDREQAFFVGLLSFCGLMNATGGVIDLTVRWTIERSADALGPTPRVAAWPRLSPAVVPLAGVLLISVGAAL